MRQRNVAKRLSEEEPAATRKPELTTPSKNEALSCQEVQNEGIWLPSREELVASTVILLIVASSAAYVANTAVYRTPEPLSERSDPSVFSEMRAMRHVEMLAGRFGERQVGTEGFKKAALYIEDQIRGLAAKAGPHLRVEVEREEVNGAYPLFILMANLTMVYRNVPNLLLRVAAAGAKADAPAILISSHFDSAIGSPGAADCASGNAVALEIARLLVESKEPPAAPVLFLWNGGEETFSMGAHGFIKTSKWREHIGVVLNLEASGTDGPDLMFQTAGSWPARVYAAAAKHPRAAGTATDMFASGLVMGDTDFRIFARDYGSVPGLDIAFLLGGYNYHTYLDNTSRLRKGIMQAMGENTVALVEAMAKAPELQQPVKSSGGLRIEDDEWAVYFDYLGLFCLHYAGKAAVLLHCVPLLLLAAVPFIATVDSSGLTSASARARAMLWACLAQGAGFLLAVVLPVLAAAVRVKLSGKPFAWWAHPSIGVAQALPMSLLGMLLPQLLRNKRGARERTQQALDWSGHWGGTVGFSALVAAVLTMVGMRSSYVAFLWAILMPPALAISRLVGPADDVRSLAGYLAVYWLPACYSLYGAFIFCQFVLEKLGMSGTWPLPWGPYIGDLVMTALFGLEAAIVATPLAPILRRWFARPRVARVLLYLAFAAAVLTGNFFPYSSAAPKRFVVQKTVWTHGDSVVEATKWSFGTVDPLPPAFMFDNVPALRKRFLRGDATLQPGRHGTWMSIFPVGDIINRHAEVDAEPLKVEQDGLRLPHLRVVKQETVGLGKSGEPIVRRIHLDVDNGFLGRGVLRMLNITGPVVAWSLTSELPPLSYAPGRPPAYMVKTADGTGTENLPLWVEVTGELHIELAMMDLTLTEELKEVMNELPDWVAVTVGTVYLSSWTG